MPKYQGKIEDWRGTYVFKSAANGERYFLKANWIQCPKGQTVPFIDQAPGLALAGGVTIDAEQSNSVRDELRVLLVNTITADYSRC